MERIYMDHAAATPVRKDVLEAVIPFLEERYYNPSANYDLGLQIKGVLEEQRQKVAGLIGASPQEIIFTSSGAEANNLAIKGIALGNRKKGNHILISSIEHHSVTNSARFLERLGFEVGFVPVDRYGLVEVSRLKEMIREETMLVSITMASNEIGTMEPISEIAKITRERGVFLHTDAVAALGLVPINVVELGVDLLTISGNALGAPRGSGALYFRKGLRLMPLIHGGIQESGRRAGTEDIPAIVGLGKACEIAASELPSRGEYLTKLRERLVHGVLKNNEGVILTGHPTRRLPGHASFCVEAVEGEALTVLLSQRGIYANTGSACASKALKVSPVLTAIGIPPALAQGSIVFTLGPKNTLEEVDLVVQLFGETIKRLRSFSPLWKEKKAA